MSRITKKLLLEAAACINPHKEQVAGLDWFMCHAVRNASGWDWATREAFERLLERHGVSTCGGLVYKGGHGVISREKAWCWHPDAQALRFDFLNLLACSMR